MSATRVAASPAPVVVEDAQPSWRSMLAGPLVAAMTLAGAIVAADSIGVELRDPDGVAGRRLVWVVILVLVLVGMDVFVRAARRAQRKMPPRAVLAEVRAERWTWRRGLAVGSALVSFYITYLAYRNLKSAVPLLRPDYLLDRQLADLDRFLFLGSDPAELTHAIFGTGAAAEVLSVIYLFYVLCVPISLAVALVFSANLPGGLFYATAAALNWPIGALSYIALPALGPVYYVPEDFRDLPVTEVSKLQGLMLDQRVEFLADPSVTGTSQSIAAFASLHVSVILTAVLAAYLLGFGRRTRLGLWVLLWSSVLATVYLGWHYVIDDVAGVAIALLALWLASKLTGFRMDPRAFRSRKSRGRFSGRGSRSRPSV
ncbi:MAG TPA: phosphatase PAP2 family protein [Thermoleophilaceae bacterium]|nr:phosphatase PAP2 family protein [Thermoleophilaceae bacterium]